MEITEEKTSAQNGVENDYVLPRRFPLDNAATIYPAARTNTYACTYRICFIMKEDVDPDILRQAAKDIIPRFPTFFAQLRAGLFWYYFEQTSDNDIVVEEPYYPCYRLKLLDSDKPAFRIIYYKRRLGVEVFHALGDGSSSINMLKTLVARYLTLKGENIPDDGSFPSLDDKPTEDEHADMFQRVYEKRLGKPEKETSSYQYKAKTIPNYFQAVHGIVPVSDIKAVSKPMGITLTEFLVANLLYAIYLNDPENRKEIKVSVPINLRPIFGVESLRNFSLFTNVGFVPKDGETTFDDIVASIKGKIKENAQRENMKKAVSRNVGSARNPLLRFTPNVIKRPLLKACYHLAGQSKFMCSLTNLGICEMPQEMLDHIDRMEVLLGGAPKETLACAVTCLNDMLNISFTGTTKEVSIQKNFFRLLSSNGIRVRVESSNKESWEDK
ncbi:MAG: hypothetical protein K6F09_05880 [Clostridiales bacterium]|nr:hypothetical protein [Clostridiales bacterium]